MGKNGYQPDSSTARKDTSIMSNVEEIKVAIEALPEVDYVRFITPTTR